jgi:ubiquinone/menaquinone biosynthesis C-methylase UbiE
MDDTDYALGRTDAEYNRLIEQAKLLRPLTERVLRAAGIGAGMHVLDVGCGVGDVSFLVSEIVGPAGSVVGVDLDPEAVALAEERRAALGIGNVAFHVGDARSAESERLFDAAVGRYVLMYMRDPAAALRRIAERVRPGGIVAFQEWVAGTSPASDMNQPVLASFLDLICTTFERSGARLQIGAELHRLMANAGLEPEAAPLAEVAMGDGAVGYRRWALLGRSLLPKIVEYGLAAREEVVETVERRLRDELMDRPLMPLSSLMIGQWARKPRTAAGSSVNGSSGRTT